MIAQDKRRQTDLSEFKDEMKSDMSDLKSDTKSRFKSLKKDMNRGFAKIDQRIDPALGSNRPTIRRRG